MVGKSYLNIIKKTSFMGNFTAQYLSRIIIVYLLAQGVTTWVAVSIPIIIELGRSLTRIIPKTAQIPVKISYKSCYFLYAILFTVFSLAMAMSTSIYTIWLFALLIGLAFGIWSISLNVLDTSNSKYQSDCLFTDEKYHLLGATAGLMISQVIYDISPSLYIVGFVVVALFNTLICMNISGVENIKDEMKPFDEKVKIDNDTKRELFVVTFFFGVLVGLMSIISNCLDAIPPLVTDQVGFVKAVYTVVALIFILIMSGKVVESIRKKGKLLLSQTLISMVYAGLLILAGIFPNVIILIILFVVYGMVSPLANPIWGSLVSAYSRDNRVYYLYINKIYFVIRIFVLITALIIVKLAVTSGMATFAVVGTVCAVLIAILHIMANNYAKRKFGHSI